MKGKGEAVCGNWLPLVLPWFCPLLLWPLVLLLDPMLPVEPVGAVWSPVFDPAEESVLEPALPVVPVCALGSVLLPAEPVVPGVSVAVPELEPVPVPAPTEPEVPVPVELPV